MKSDGYYKARFILGEEVVIHRMRLTVQIIRQLLKLVPEYRGHKISEDNATYEPSPLDDLLYNVP
jgi:hypothetical protein